VTHTHTHTHTAESVEELLGRRGVGSLLVYEALKQLRRQRLGSRVEELLVRRGVGSLLVYEASAVTRTHS
jgi:predicted N-acetyltransferase YhbS